MDLRPIGIFDSGLGGLTAVREIMRVLPGENLVYFGDTGRVPYGTRSRETIIKYTRCDLNFLMTYNIKAAVVACGTASSIALPVVRGEFPVPMVGVIDCAARAARDATRNGRIGVIGTPATIKSDAYRRALHALDPALQVVSNPCALLVPLVEDGRFARGDTVAQLLVREYLAPLLERGIDTLILGCTHYPLLTDVFRDVCGPDVALISPGATAAADTKALLLEQGLLNTSGRRRQSSYFVSDNTVGFARSAEMFLGCPLEGELTRIEIEKYENRETE
ncbi:glutamate racemase [Feifania hominis]|uniref:Glutamate racemase n=1 Tax=Feifania hominis TaxID=2763660 RepID=A0A926DGK5_9FIRM|nr:glutamate racemase [Feifania hominis]MBC8536670.1 glutamate racemase [Feifania hominis]